MATFTEKKYLDYAGLAKFWELIKGKFVASAEASYTEDNVVLTLKDANGSQIGEAVTLTAASATQAGVMTKAQAQKLADLDQVLINGVPFKGLNIAGTKVETDGNAYANIGIALEKVNGVESIVLKDLATSGTAISSFPVSQFVIDGLLESSDVKIIDGKPWLSLDFKLADGTQKSELIDLSSLVDVYTNGNGITVDETNNSINIKIKADEKYLTVDANGLATTAQLVTDFEKAASDAQAAAEGTAKNYTDAEIAKVNTKIGTVAEGKDVVTMISDAQAAAIAQAATDTKAYVDPKFEAIDDKIGTVAEGDTVVGMIGDAEQAAKDYADQQIEAIVGTSGSLADVLADAKEYTDEKIGEVNTKIGTVAEGKDVVTMISDAQAAAAKAGTDAAAQALTDAKAYADGKLAEITDAENGILAQAKAYADEKDEATLGSAKTYTDEEVKKLADGAVADNTAAIEVLNGTGDGSVAKAAADALADAQSYTETRLGEIPENSTVKDYVDGLAGNYDAAGSAQAVYDAMVRLTEDEIAAIVAA